MCLLYHRQMDPICCPMGQARLRQRRKSGARFQIDKENQAGQHSDIEKSGLEPGIAMKTKDKGRKWMWLFLVVGAGLQSYAVRELVTVFALFAVGFAALAVVTAGGYVTYRGLEAGVAQVARLAAPVVATVPRGLGFAEELGRRAIGRPGSEAAR